MPQTETKFGTFDELLALATEPMRPVLTRLREIIVDIDPQAFEVVRLGERSAHLVLDPAK
jgi:hypothetical protein